jgi:hypothetical protein
LTGFAALATFFPTLTFLSFLPCARLFEATTDEFRLAAQCEDMMTIANMHNMHILAMRVVDMD